MKEVRWPMPLLRRSGLGRGGRSMLRPRSLWGRMRRELRRVRGRPLTMLVLEHHPEPEVHAPRTVILRWAPLPTKSVSLRAPTVVLGAARKPRREDIVAPPGPTTEPLPLATKSPAPPLPPRRAARDASTPPDRDVSVPLPEVGAPEVPRRPTPPVTVRAPMRPRTPSAPPVLLKAPRPEPEPPIVQAPPPVPDAPPAPKPLVRPPPAPSVALLRPSSTRPPERAPQVPAPRPRAVSTPPSSSRAPSPTPSLPLSPLPSPLSRPLPSPPRLVPDAPDGDVPDVPVLPPDAPARLERPPTARPRSRSTPTQVRLRAPQLLLRQEPSPEQAEPLIAPELPPRTVPPRKLTPLTPTTTTPTTTTTTTTTTKTTTPKETVPTPRPRTTSTGAPKLEAGEARQLLKELRHYQQSSGGKLDSKDGEDRRSGHEPPIAQAGLSRQRRVLLARQLGLEGNPADPILLQALERTAAGGDATVEDEAAKRRRAAVRAKLARAPVLRPEPLTSTVPTRARRQEGILRIAGLFRRGRSTPKPTASRGSMPVLKQTSPPSVSSPPPPPPPPDALPTIKTLAAPRGIVGRVKAVRRAQRGVEQKVEIRRAPGAPAASARPLPPVPPPPPPPPENKPLPPLPKAPGPDRSDRTWDWGPQGFVPPHKGGEPVVTPPSGAPLPKPDAPIPLPEAPGANRDRSRSAPPRMERPTTPFEAAPSDRVQWRSSSFVRAVGGDPSKVPDARAPSWSAPSPLAGARATPAAKVATEAPTTTQTSTASTVATTTVRLTNVSESALERLIERMLVRDPDGRRLVEALEDRLDELRRGAAVRRKG